MQTITASQAKTSTKIKDYVQLVKLRLTLMVVFSTGVGFIVGSSNAIQWGSFFILLFSGFLITGAANGINQIIEKDLDKLMTRTQNRPIAQGRLSLTEAIIAVTAMSFLGVFLLGYYINGLSALIGGLSLFIYAFIYTPLKQKTSFSVIVGAIAGAAPPVIGYTAAFGQIDSIAWMLFGIQFVWQLPHFWALAWVLNDEYNKAGFYLLPSKKGRTKKSALITFISALLLMPVVYLSYYVGATNIVITILMGLASLHFIHQAYTLYKTREIKEARTLMFGSFYYLPIVQILLIIAHFIN